MSETTKLTETGAVIAWWSHLHGWGREGDDIVRKGNGDSATRARLRRESTVRDVLLDPSVQGALAEIVTRAGADKKRPLDFGQIVWRGERLAILAPSLARVKPGRPSAQSFAVALGRTTEGKVPGPDDQPRLSRDRFAALVRSLGDRRDPTRLLTALRRVVDKLGDVPFDVPRFINDVYYAGSPSGNEIVVRRWTFDYFQTLSTNDASYKKDTNA